jgi:hypothetical protein
MRLPPLESLRFGTELQCPLETRVFGHLHQHLARAGVAQA